MNRNIINYLLHTSAKRERRVKFILLIPRRPAPLTSASSTHVGHFRRRTTEGRLKVAHGGNCLLANPGSDNDSAEILTRRELRGMSCPIIQWRIELLHVRYVLHTWKYSAEHVPFKGRSKTRPRENGIFAAGYCGGLP